MLVFDSGGLGGTEKMKQVVLRDGFDVLKLWGNDPTKGFNSAG